MCNVSIIVPIYNVERYLDDCLKSIINQTLKEIEIICVNDGSTDGSLEIAERYKAADNRIVLLNQENKGLSAARNAGLDMAKGEYVYFCDSDDYLDLDILEHCYQCAKTRELDVIRFSTKNFYDENPEKVLFDEDACDEIMSGMELLERSQRHYTPSVCILFINRNYLQRYSYRFIEGIIHEDHAFYIQLLLKARRVYQTAEWHYNRRYRKGSIMHSIQHDKAAVGMLKTANFLADSYTDETAKVLGWYFNFFYHHFMGHYKYLSKDQREKLNGEIQEYCLTCRKNKYYGNGEIHMFCIFKNGWIPFVKGKDRIKQLLKRG